MKLQDQSRNRWREIAALVPVAGAILIFVPLIWSSGPEGTRTSNAAFYLFGIWLLLIGFAALVSSKLKSGPKVDK